MSPRVAFRTLGCRLNQYETDALAADFDAAGYTVVPFDEPADVYVLNSCTITAQADRKSRNLVYRALRREQATVVLTGCFAERSGPDFARDGRVLVVGNDAKYDIRRIVEAADPASAAAPPTTTAAPAFAAGPADASAVAADRFGFAPTRGVFHTRAAVKIQDGCDRFCTYCIVPRVRGRAVSREPASVLEEVRKVVANGARELVVTGVNLGRYGAGGLDFTGLLARILDTLPADGSVRLRISSLEPDGLDERFPRLFEDPRLMPHVHLCLQSGSDAVLRRMGRRYAVSDFRRIATRLRAVDPDLNLTTDMIVGFPGETEADFAQSVAAAWELGFGHIHVFPFSPREGTPAARRDDGVASRVKTERARRLRETAGELKRRYYGRMVGREDEVLAERVVTEPDPGIAAPQPSRPAAPAAVAPVGGQQSPGARGYGRYYVPVFVEGAGLERNRVYPVLLNRLVHTPEGPLLEATRRTPS